MGKSWLNTNDAPLLAACQNVLAVISPVPANYGASAADVTALTPLVSGYESALTTATNPPTRTKVTIAAKDVQKAGLIVEMRYLYKKFNAANLSPDKREELGLPIKDVHPSPVPAPTTKPVVKVKQVSGRNVTVLITDETTPTSRKKPAGAREAEIFSHVGETAPEDLRSWSYEGQATRNSFTVPFPATAASGAKVWVAARWCNGKGSPGPVSDPTSTYVTASVSEAM